MAALKKVKELKLKKCRKCNIIKSENDFHNCKRHEDGKNTQCKSCANREGRARYNKTKKTYNKKKKRRRERNKKWRWNYLLRHPCVDCGEDDPIVLAFDHVGHEEKVDTISNMVFAPASLEKIKREVEKCEVRCANCHMRRHHRERIELEDAFAYDGTSGQDD